MNVMYASNITRLACHSQRDSGGFGKRLSLNLGIILLVLKQFPKNYTILVHGSS